MKAALQPVRLKTGLFKYLSVRQEVDLSSRLLRPSQRRKQAIHQFYRRNAPLICIIMNLTVLIYLYAHPFRKSIYNRRADSVKSAACLICIIIKFAARMKGG